MSKHQEPMNKGTMKWPYPVRYREESEITADVLILGGGISGCHAAINAVKKGASVVIVEKGAVIRSGSGGAGVDHWHNAFTNPCSKNTPDEIAGLVTHIPEYPAFPAGYGAGHVTYIERMESWDALLDMEKMGMKIRDVDDQFAGAEFRDDETKLMFAYDYENRHIIRVQGANVKPLLQKELKRLGVQIYDRVMATSLLTEGGQSGARVIGATGVNTRTGEFYIFKAKATILCAAQALRLWAFSTELQGLAGEHDDPNAAGDGLAMAWQAGAEFTMMERSMPVSSGFRYPAYGTGNAHNTWFACSMVDAQGKEIPWVNRDGQPLKTVSERYYPAPGQKVILHDPAPTPIHYDICGSTLIPDLPQRIMNGEYQLPFFADLPGMPEHERRAIFGLMVGNEGKTRIPVYQAYTQAGFDPDQDMLQANVLPPQMAGMFMPWWNGVGPPQWRGVSFGYGGGLAIDWNLKTNLEGLYAAGNQLVGACSHTIAATTGRYAGRNAAEYALKANEAVIDRQQVAQEKNRVYRPVEQPDGIGWKELQAGLCRVMQDYCGEYKNESLLKTGLDWLNSIRESEASRAYARNPHELMRTLEAMSRLVVGELIMHSSLERRASSPRLSFNRLDYPEIDPPEWNKFVTVRLENGQVKAGALPFNYWLLPPNAASFKENYQRHCNL